MKQLLFLLLLIISISASATGYTVQGTVHTLRDNADDIFGEDIDLLMLNGVTSAGNCPTHGGLVMIVIPKSSDRAFSIALAAQMAEKELYVSLDDTRLTPGGSCIVRWLQLAN